jgi:hypothetical protein
MKGFKELDAETKDALKGKKETATGSSVCMSKVGFGANEIGRRMTIGLLPTPAVLTIFSRRKRKVSAFNQNPKMSNLYPRNNMKIQATNRGDHDETNDKIVLS